eukprot:3181538-Pleurochrysis_carterae.AAC.1
MRTKWSRPPVAVAAEIILSTSRSSRMRGAIGLHAQYVSRLLCVALRFRVQLSPGGAHSPGRKSFSEHLREIEQEAARAAYRVKLSNARVRAPASAELHSKWHGHERGRQPDGLANALRWQCWALRL